MFAAAGVMTTAVAATMAPAMAATSSGFGRRDRAGESKE
jgi:hypothetical protein